ncbi:MAG TPA: DUF1446 domain-containing protein [Firmicutes bacterium]|jgi:hypothetical protein|nr:DUF1446 domain-containing protein [Bacillota bacterium]
MLQKEELRIFSATSFMGHGVDRESLERAMDCNLDFVIAQGTTTDAGPYYLGAGLPVMAEEALRRDLELIITIAKANSVPFIISAGGCGSDSTTALVLELIEDICTQHHLSLKLGVVWSEVERDYLLSGLEEGRRAKRIVPHPVLEEYLSAENVRQNERIVAQVGPEVIMDLWASNPGLDGIIAGRSLDVGLYAAIPLLHGFDKGLAMHFGKIMEDGALAATPGSGNDGLLGIIRSDHFDVRPTNPKRRCTPESVTGHAFYERSDPSREANPGGDLDISQATYAQLDEVTVRVSGAKWIEAPAYTVKLEGVSRVGYRSICIAGMRDPQVVKNVDLILKETKEIVDDYFAYLPVGEYSLSFKVYGRDAVLGPFEPTPYVQGHEICVLVDVVAKTQKLANSVCSFASSTISHHGFPGRLSTAGNIAIPFSPGRSVPVGEVYEFTIWHAWPLDDPKEPFRTTIETIEPKGGKVQ